MKLENYQFELPDPTGMSTDYYVANADEVTSKGIEIEGFIKPSELLTFSITYGFVTLNMINSRFWIGWQTSFLRPRAHSFIVSHLSIRKRYLRSNWN